MDDDALMDDEEELQEVEIVIDPRVDRLDELGISLEEFEEGVSHALDAFHDLVESQGDPDQTPDIDQLKVMINGTVHLLGDIAVIQILGEMDSDADLN